MSELRYFQHRAFGSIRAITKDGRVYRTSLEGGWIKSPSIPSDTLNDDSWTEITEDYAAGLVSFYKLRVLIEGLDETAELERMMSTKPVCKLLNPSDDSGGATLSAIAKLERDMYAALGASINTQLAAARAEAERALLDELRPVFLKSIAALCVASALEIPARLRREALLFASTSDDFPWLKEAEAWFCPAEPSEENNSVRNSYKANDTKQR